MKVLLIAPNFNTRGGIQIYSRTMLSGLGSTAEVLFVGPYSEDESSIRRMGRLPLDCFRVMLRLLKGDIDLVHINTAFLPKPLIREGLILLISRLFSVKILVFFHGWDPSLEETIRNRFPWIFRWVFSQANMVVVLAESFKHFLVNSGVGSEVVTERTFVDDELFSGIGEQQIKGRIENKSGAFTILFLSRVLREKGIYTALEAYALVRESYNNVRMVVAGDGEELGSAKSFVSDRGIEGVTFAGFVESGDKVDILMQSDVFILPTFYGEGLPISLLEAMRCGLPVITRPDGGLKEFIAHGTMGWLIEGHDPAAYAAAISTLISDKAQLRAMSLHNYHYAMGHLSGAGAVGRMLNVYSRLHDPYARDGERQWGLGSQTMGGGGQFPLWTPRQDDASVAQIDSLPQDE